MAKKKEAAAPAEGAAPAKAAAAAPAPEAAAPADGQAAAPAEASSSSSSSTRRRKPGVPPRRGKKLRNHLRNQTSKIGKEGALPIRKAVSLLKTMKRAKFDETVEIHMWLGIDPTQNDQNVRGAVSLPHGIGKSVRVVVFCQGDDVAKAKEAGADFAGGQDLIDKVQKENWLDFDVALASQSMMGLVSRL